MLSCFTTQIIHRLHSFNPVKNANISSAAIGNSCPNVQLYRVFDNWMVCCLNVFILFSVPLFCSVFQNNSAFVRKNKALKILTGRFHSYTPVETNDFVYCPDELTVPCFGTSPAKFVSISLNSSIVASFPKFLINLTSQCSRIKFSVFVSPWCSELSGSYKRETMTRKERTQAVTHQGAIDSVDKGLAAWKSKD